MARLRRFSRRFARGGLGLAWLLPVAWAAGEAGRVNDARPNVLFIVSDDHGWADYGFMGHSRIETPHLDRLAARSLVFDRGYTPVPLCRPSLCSMLTGLYPHQHGVTGNDPALPDEGVNPMASRGNPKYARYHEGIVANFARRPNLVRDLGGRGYDSLQTGKWWEGDPVKTAGFRAAMTAGDGKGDRHGGAGLTIGREGIGPVTRFIEAAGEKPWFVWYAPMLPHVPHTPPEDLLRKYRGLAPGEAEARYWACVEWFDRGCGQLFDFLERKGLRDKTIVVYTCDNGWVQDPERVDRHAPRSKLSPYEGGGRTPIMVSWPGKLPPRRDREHLASTLDLWPTLASLLGTPVPAGLPGIDLTDQRRVAARRRIFGEQHPHDIADIGQPARGVESRWVIDGWWKLIVHDSGAGPPSGPELYQLRDDPWEKSDLAAREPGKTAELSGRLAAWWSPDPAAGKGQDVPGGPGR